MSGEHLQVGLVAEEELLLNRAFKWKQVFISNIFKIHCSFIEPTTAVTHHKGSVNICMIEQILLMGKVLCIVHEN